MTIPAITTARRRDNQQPRAVEVDANGSVYTTPAAGAMHDVNIEEVDGNAVVGDGPANNRLEVSSYMQVAAAGDTTLRGGALDDDAVAAATIGQNVRAYLAGFARTVWERLTSRNGALSTRQGDLMIHACESFVGITGSADVGTFGITGYHRGEGDLALYFDKTGVSATFAYLTYDLDSVDAGDFFHHGYLDYWVYLSDVADLDYVLVRLGINNANFWEWQVPAADLAVGWNHVKHPIEVIDVESGLGCQMWDLDWLLFGVRMNAPPDTIADVRFDDIRLTRNFETHSTDPQGTGYTQVSLAMQPTADDLKTDANMQIGDADVGPANQMPVSVADGDDVALGATTDAEAAGNGSVIALLKRLRTLMASLLVVGGGTEATAQRVTIADDSTGLLSVDDNGGSLTVDQGTHDNLQCNANIQVGDADVSGTNPVPVSTDSDMIWQTPTVTAGAYVANDAVGGLLTFANAAVSGEGGVVKNVLIVDDNGQDAEMELWLFRESFVAMADNAPWAPSEADLRKLVAIITTADGAWFAAGTPSVARIEVSQEIKLTATSLFGQLVTRGTPTFAATDDVSVAVGILQD